VIGKPALVWIAAIGTIALLHGVVTFVLWTAAGLAPGNAGVAALAKMIGFPMGHLPERWLSPAALGWVWMAVTSLAWGGLIVAGAALAWRYGGAKAVVALALCLVAIPAATVWVLNQRKVDWYPTTVMHYDAYAVAIPQVFTVSATENQHRVAIHENLFPGQPLPKPDSQRWYFRYASTASGFPEYEAIAIAATYESAPSAEAFLEVVTRQRDPAWSNAQFMTIRSGPNWVLAEAKPTNPTSGLPKAGLLRILSRAPHPTNGLWLAFIARADRIAPETLVAIFEHSRASIVKN
jgi:hypothetical protein